MASSVIALFGATGKTGRRVLDGALAAGHQVRALVRDPSGLSDRSAPGLTIVPGDVLDPDAVARTIEGADVVVSVIGQTKGSPHDLQERGTANMVEAMKANGLCRIISLTGGGVVDPHDRPKAADKVIQFLLKRLSGHVLADAQAHLKVLRASGLDWTVVRGPRLTEKPGTGTYRLGWVGVGTGTQISRDDLADFILTQVDDTTFVHALPFVSA